jgi:hypothetical protein
MMTTFDRSQGQTVSKNRGSVTWSAVIRAGSVDPAFG